MNKIKLVPNKHTGIIFNPRSGSHVLREFFSAVNSNTNLGELFNPAQSLGNRSIINSLLMGNRKFSHLGLNNNGVLDLENCEYDDTENIETLKLEAELNNYFVFTINPISYCDSRETLFKKLINSDHIQYIRLKRADLLSSLLSTYFAKTSDVWHRVNPNEIIRPPESLTIPMEFIVRQHNNYIESEKDINKYFPDISTIYYEQFQNNVNNLRNLFDGIPKKIVSNPYNKIGIDYKKHIENIDEIEDYYEQFVNDNKEYFPQYFGKLPHITIPASQGRQPRDLSQLQMAVGV